MNLYRLTTNGMLYSYRANLQQSYNTLANASNKVQTGRNFNSYAEDPAAASRAFQLRREHWQANAQQRNNTNVLTNFGQAWKSFDLVKNDLVDKKGKVNLLISKNDPDGTARKTLGQSILESAEAAVQTMNVKYSGKFLFAGADGLNAPFTWEDKPKLDFEGIPVLADQNYTPLTYQEDVVGLDQSGKQVVVHKAGDEVRDENGDLVNINKGEPMQKVISWQAVDENGKLKVDSNGKPVMHTVLSPVKEGFGEPVKDADGNPVMEKQLCFRGIPVDSPAGSENYIRLQQMMEEATYVDIGLGMQENKDGTPVKSTVYNSALSGLEFLDFGVDEDGDPKNAISLMKKIGDLLMTASDIDGKFQDTDAYNELCRLHKKLEDAQDKMDVEYNELDTKASFLEGNDTRLTEEIKALNEQILDIEEIDPVAAITALSWAQYCYNAGLKIGTSILSQSLIDYMN